MLKRMILLLALTLPVPASAYVITGGGVGSTEHPDEEGYKVSCGGPYFLCGYFDTEDNEVISQKFEMAFPFSDGLARVRIDGKFGFIDRTGSVVIEPRFAGAGSFSAGKAKVLVEGKIGLIDKAGQFVLEPKFTNIFLLGEHKALITQQACRPRYSAQCHSLGNLSTIFDHLSAHELEYMIVDLQTGIVSAQPYIINAFENEDTAGRVWARLPASAQFGLLGPQGAWIALPKYQTVEKAYNGSAKACLDHEAFEWRPSKCGLISPEGRELTEFVFPKSIRHRFGDLVVVQQDGKSALYKANGERDSGKYDEIIQSDDPNVLAVRLGTEWYGLDRNGRRVKHPNDGRVQSECPNGVKAIWQSGKLKIVGPDGVQTEETLFQHPYRELNCGGWTTVSITLDGANPMSSENWRWGFIDPNGKLIGGKIDFESIEFARGDRGIVKKSGKWGVIDARGDFVVPAQYDSFHRASKDVFRVVQAGKVSWVDIDGHQQPEPKDDRAEDRAKVMCCGDGRARFITRVVDGTTLWGLATPDGREIVSPKYRALRCYINGVAWVADDSRRKWCQIDMKGQIRNEDQCAPSFNGVSIFDAFRESMSEDPYESLVLWERALLDYGRGVREAPPKLVSGNRF